jgi:starch synthase
MRVLYVCSEIFPLIKTGGLADVSAALPAALADVGIDVRVLVPGYPAVLKGMTELRDVGDAIPDLPSDTEGRIRIGRLPDGTTAYVLDAPVLFNRPGNPYIAPGGYDWPDNAVRFAALAWAATGFCSTHPIDPWWRPDVIHSHDWQGGLVPAYLELLPERSGGFSRPGTVMTIHNIAYQGQFSPQLLSDLRLPHRAFNMDGVEYYGGIGFLKGGCHFADRLTTVSPTYALEIQTPEHGFGMEGVLAARAGVLSGILNGVDYSVWDPTIDTMLPANYAPDDLTGKAACKAALQAEFGLEQRPDAPIACVVSRLTHHKGLDLVLAVIGDWIKAGGQLVVLGSGESWTETGFRYLHGWYQRAVGIHVGYDEALSHRIQAGSDIILVPSRSEPCGLTQLYGLKYGTLPLVRRTGGLADTVVDANHAAIKDGTATGFQFVNANAQELQWALRRAMDLYRKPDIWRAMQRNAMTRDFSWADPAREYRSLFEAIAG